MIKRIQMYLSPEELEEKRKREEQIKKVKEYLKKIKK